MAGPPLLLNLVEGDSEPGRVSTAIAVLGIDPGKNNCSVVGLDGTGQVILRRRMQRKSIAVLGAKLSPCIIAMEACCGAHHLGRVLSTLGHTVRLMSFECVRPYVKAQKNDDRDAEEAATRTMRSKGENGALQHCRIEVSVRRYFDKINYLKLMTVALT